MYAIFIFEIRHSLPIQPESMLEIAIMCSGPLELLSSCLRDVLADVMGCVMDWEALVCTYFRDLAVAT